MTKRAVKRLSLDYCNGFDDARGHDDSVTETAIADWACDYAATVADSTEDPNEFDEAYGSYVQGYHEGVARFSADADEAYDFITAQFKLHNLR